MRISRDLFGQGPSPGAGRLRERHVAILAVSRGCVSSILLRILISERFAVVRSSNGRKREVWWPGEASGNSEATVELLLRRLLPDYSAAAHRTHRPKIVRKRKKRKSRRRRRQRN
ncbi:uncharacterized protein LOC143904325 isoform X2 [Temnothorax americanus]|uniref:uncharacterized protein LOC143904325 isoform X2 n=1 Tax=Temnothorax americanus TaxID=1964332 RepID=UPI004067D626